MSGHLSHSRREVRETVRELRRHLGLFSFQNDMPTVESTLQLAHRLSLVFDRAALWSGWWPDRGRGRLPRPCKSCRDPPAVVESGRSWIPTRECYVPALSGWGIDPSRILVLRPATLQETCWAIEQCLRCPGVSATWAWVDQRIPERVHRRWQLAAEVGGGVGLFFRPVQARREPDLGRLTIAGHAAGWRPGGNQADAYRGAVSPGRPGRQRPGVGDRPCRGSCASGSRSGRSSDCGARGPSLDGRSLCCLPARISDLSITVCSPKAERLGLRIGQPLAEAKALLPESRLPSR